MEKVFIKTGLSLLLLLCLLQMPYGYYQFIRFICMVVFVYLGYSSIVEKKEGEAFIYFALAVLFQPLFKIALGRQLWNIIDVVVAVGLLYSAASHWKHMTTDRSKSK